MSPRQVRLPRPGRWAPEATASTSRTTGNCATQAYGRSNATILQSTDDGDSYGGIDPPWLPSENKTYLAAVATDPNNGGGVYASSNQNLWQSTNGGATWPNKVAIPGAATHVDIAPVNSNNVVVAVGGRVLVSTDALVPGGLNLTDITRTCPADSSGASLSIPMIRQPFTPCSVG